MQDDWQFSEPRGIFAVVYSSARFAKAWPNSWVRTVGL